MITEEKYNEIITYAHDRLATYPHLDPYDIAHDAIMHPEFSAEGTEWRRLFKTAMYRALDITNKEVALEAAGFSNRPQAEGTAECGSCGELSPVAGWRRGMCVKCYSSKWYYENQDYVKSYRKKHRQKYLAYKREWYKANRDRLRREARDYYYANREKVNAYSREYYRTKVDKEARKAYNRKYYKRNREKIIAQVKANQKRKKKKNG